MTLDIRGFDRLSRIMWRTNGPVVAMTRVDIRRARCSRTFDRADTVTILGNTVDRSDLDALYIALTEESRRRILAHHASVKAAHADDALVGSEPCS